MTTYEPMAGDWIDNACQEAVKLAIENGDTVTFKFNDIEMTAGPGDDPALLSRFFSQESARRYEEYQRSPQGIAAAEERRCRLHQSQIRMDALMDDMKATFDTGLDGVVDWLSQYTPLADDNGVSARINIVHNALLAAGYINNEYTGDAFVKGDKRIVGRYIVGQAINCMERGMPPHPMLVSFAEQYRELP